MLPRRRDALLTSLFGTGYVGLRALATGLPAWYLMNPRKATAADLACAIDNKANAQYLIVSVSSAGDPMSCNCPGTYDGDGSAAIHPADTRMAPKQFMLGSQQVTAATPWSTLTSLDRTAFFHHVTLANVHGDQPKVMRLMGATSSGEMLVSAYAKHLAPCLGTVQPEPVAVGAGGNASELVSYGGRALQSISPTQLKQLLGGGGSTTGGTRTSPLVSLRTVRDKYIDQLAAMAKTDGTGVQKQFLDAFSTTQQQVRQLSMDLATTLSKISGNDPAGQALAAAALIAANVTPVVTIHIPFGGDNHNDNNLQTESDQTVGAVNGTTNANGVNGINAVLSALAAQNLQDKVTFATLNVFGRNLNGISKTMMQQGRDHYGNHSVAVMIGKNIKPGVVGGVMTLSGGSSGGALGAADIDSSTGAGRSGADIARTDTHVVMARTLGVALGIPASALTGDFIQGSNTKIISSMLTNV